jgi:predicted dehydrogenase
MAGKGTMLRICQIGCGGQAKQSYIPSLARYRREHPGALIPAACCDTDAARAEAFRRLGEFDRAYVSYREMLEAEKPDAVILTTPYTVTAKIAADILLRGFPLLLEKPPGDSYSECQMIAGAARKSGVLHQVAFNRRHIPLIRALKDDIAGRGAKIQHIDFQMYRVNRRENSFYSTAIHGIDLVCHLMQSPCRTARFAYGNLERFGAGVFNISIQAEFESLSTAQLSFCPVSGFIKECLTVTTDYGVYVTDIPIWNDLGTGGISLYRENKTEPLLREAAFDGTAMFESNGFYEQLRVFFSHVQAGVQPSDDIFSALTPMALMERIKNRQTSCRVEPGGYPPRTPTDPDVPH